jgi:hypothetical protein
MTRAADKSQFDLNTSMIGRTSVWPSTRRTKARCYGRKTPHDIGRSALDPRNSGRRLDKRILCPFEPARPLALARRRLAIDLALGDPI